ncbi:hypothetical protein [Pseudoxanthomonas mexicana]|uniref:hypothetical protein n=1 Tax=Pseudoxanthomonas mexicana TaxID=128785 RepID=UPI00398B46D1
MPLFKIVAAGALGYLAYQAWQRSKRNAAQTDAPSARSRLDDGGTTPPHGDPRRSEETLETEPVRAAAQSSPGFGGT